MDKNPFELVQQLSAFYFVSRSLHIVAELGVADAVGDQAIPIETAARATGSDEDALSRVVRLLSSYGVFELHGTFVSHTPASKLLRSDHPASLRDLTRMLGFPVMWRSAEGLLQGSRINPVYPYDRSTGGSEASCFLGLRRVEEPQSLRN